VASGQHLRTLRGHTIGVTKVEFSRDGKELVTASADQTARLWDVATGEEIRGFHGHTDPIWGVTFSPDGTRLATASWDKTVRLWDVASGQPLRTLHGHSDKVWSVAFSSDGAQLISAGSDQTVRLWDARPLNPALRMEAEAAALLDNYRADGLLQSEAAGRLRQQAGVSTEVRELAQRLLEAGGDDPLVLNTAAWHLVRAPNGSAVHYEAALKLAQTAARLRPDDGNVVNTLGVAQYRRGQYLEALANLSRARDLNLLRRLPKMKLDIGRILLSPWLLPVTNLASYDQPTDLAFLAMAHYRTGHTAEADEYLSRLREMVQRKDWAEDDETQGFVREAEALIRPPGK
jgi:tetratricopeptide (TPR) repeat protein